MYNYDNVDYVKNEYEKLFVNEFDRKYIEILDDSFINKYWLKLCKNYNRPYHNFDHISMGLKEIDKMKNLKYSIELKLAWIFHDFVVGCRNAELITIMFVQQFLNDCDYIGNIEYLKKEIIYDLIQETSLENTFNISGYKRLDEFDIIHDIDFMILGQEYETFLDYDNNIEKEYGDRFNYLERVKFLKHIYKLPQTVLFRTNDFGKRFDNQVTKNIEKIFTDKYIKYSYVISKYYDNQNY